MYVKVCVESVLLIVRYEDTRNRTIVPAGRDGRVTEKEFDVSEFDTILKGIFPGCIVTRVLGEGRKLEPVTPTTESDKPPSELMLDITGVETKSYVAADEICALTRNRVRVIPFTPGDAAPAEVIVQRNTESLTMTTEEQATVLA